MSPMVNPFFEDVKPGMEIPSLVRGPMTAAHIVRWASAIELWHRIHYDQDFAQRHDGLPDLLVNGSWKQHVLIQALTDWAGERGWLWKLAFQYRGMNVRGDTLVAWGRVERVRDAGRAGIVELTVGMRDQRDEEGTPGTASVVLPKRGGEQLPYPFDPAWLELR